MNYNKFIFCFLLSFISSFALATEESTIELLDQAQLLHKQEKYAEAVKLYTQIIDSGHYSESVYYNLGTAHVKEANVPSAILYLRKSLKLDPGNADSQQNLKIARSMVDTEIIPIPEFFITRYWTQFSKILSSTVWAIIGLMSLLGLLAGFYFWLIGTDVDKKKKAFYLAIAALLFFLVSFAAGLTKLSNENDQNQAVLMKATPLLIGADDRSEEIMNLSPGVEVEILDEIGQFYKVRLFDRELGWINKELLAVI